MHQRDNRERLNFPNGGGSGENLWHNEFIKLTSLKNLFRAWQNFSADKRNKRDVIVFAANLENELLSLQKDLRGGNYIHGSYQRFVVHDPKRREIHVAGVRDRVAHRLLYNYLLPIFDRVWLDCSFSCRPGKGQHRSIKRVERAILQATHNYTRNYWSVKCDVQKFFYHLDQDIIFRLLCRRVFNPNVQNLLWKVIDSWRYPATERGIPIGNLTSQIFANVYLHELDIFVKHRLRLPWYYRYADDLIILTETKEQAEQAILAISNFVSIRLCLTLHPNKIIFRPCHSGVDWLGVVLLPGYAVLRPATRRRMIRNIEALARMESEGKSLAGMIASYNGLLKGVARKNVDSQIAQTVALYRAL